MLTLTYEYKLKPNRWQAQQNDHDLEVCRQMWNYALKKHKGWMASRKCPINACSLHNVYILAADAPYSNFQVEWQLLTQAKQFNPQLSSVNAQVLQQVPRPLNLAFRLRHTHGAGFPHFKKTRRTRSVVFPQLGKAPLLSGAVKPTSLGVMAQHQSRPNPKGFTAKQARVVKRASGYYVMLTFSAEVAIPEPPLVGHVVGVDVRLEYFLSTSNGLQLERTKFFADLQSMLKLPQSRLKRKQIGAANWQQSQAKVTRLHKQIANTRKDFHFKVAHQLCDAADVIVVEDLNLIGLSWGTLGKHMLDASHGLFLHGILPWVTCKRGKAVVNEPARGISQECLACWAEVPKTLSTRWHECPCGCSMPRDVASGIVFKDRFISRGARGCEKAPGEVLAGSVLHSSQDSVNEESPSIALGLIG
jgi:putative transposase